MKSRTILFKKKLKVIIFAASFAVLNTLVAQGERIVLNESMLTQRSFETFTSVSIQGSQSWSFNAFYGAVMSGFSSGSSYANEDWLISSPMDLRALEDVYLSFEHTRGNADVFNVGVSEGWYKVFATDNYTGDVSTTEWEEISVGLNWSFTKAWQFVFSGFLTLPESVCSSSSRIAFKYVCNDAQSATWEVRNIKVSGFSTTDPEDHFFKITTFNAEWLSCDANGPDDEDLQIRNVASVIRSINSDFVALQEVGTSSAYTTIDTLVRLLGDEWGGAVTPWSTHSNCLQHLGMVYKKSRLRLIDGSLLSTAGSSYAWSNGRYPVLYDMRLITDSGEIPISFINIHPKAMGDAESYARRKQGSIGLKTLLDSPEYSEKNVILLGDFNDYLVGTQCKTCGGDSPYRNFIDDTAHYKGLTSDLTDPDYRTPGIDHIVVSNELFSSYEENSSIREVSAIYSVENYKETTSDHTPVSITLRAENIPFSTQTVRRILDSGTDVPLQAWVADDVLHISGLFSEEVWQVYTISGVLVYQAKASGSFSSVSCASFLRSQGFYIIRQGSRSAKVVCSF